MKIFIKLLLMAVLFTSCNKEVKRDGYLIEGNAKGIYNGIRVYLKGVDQNNRQIDLDTAIIMNEKFSFEGKVLEPEMYYLTINSVNGNLPVIVENGIITIDIDKENLINSKLYGTKNNEALMTYNHNLKSLIDQRQEINLTLRDAAQVNDAQKVKSLQENMSEVNLKLINLPYEFIEDNPDNYYALIIMENMLNNRNAELVRILNSFQNISDDLKATEKGQTLLSKIATVQSIIEAQINTEIGKIAPDFSAPTPEGNLLSLKEIMGKVTLIDFWAAWCGPCRRENPNIVNIYNKYHSKGLEIIGVSLDGVRQPDPKAAWIKAIEDDNLIWHQVSNLNYFNGPIAKMYNIQSIPASFILDADGKIIAKNLRGQALEAKIAELLD